MFGFKCRFNIFIYIIDIIQKYIKDNKVIIYYENHQKYLKEIVFIGFNCTIIIMMKPD